MSSPRSVLVVVLVSGCSFDAGSGGGAGQLGSGGGDTIGSTTGDGLGTAASGDAASTTAAATSAATTMPPDTGIATTTGEHDGTTTISGGTDDGSTTEPVDPCASPPTVMIDLGVADGVVSEPMQVSGSVAYSEVAEMGSITFSLDLDCPDQYAIWGHVYDGEPGLINIVPGDPADAYHVEVDATAIEWAYGCDTLVSAWSWQAISTHAPDCSDDSMVVFDLAAGPHTLMLRNVEAGEALALPPSAAMLDGVIITNDLDYHP